MSYKALIFYFLAGLAYPLSAQQPQGIQLFLVDGWDQLPVAGVTLTAGSASYISDAQGRITIRHPVEVAQLLLQKSGYYPVTLAAGTIASGQVIRLFPILESDPIQVAASKLGFSELEIASQRQRIGAQDFGHKNGLGDLLAIQNGVFLKSYGGAEGAQSIAMRGLGAEQTLILLDGIPVNSGQTGLADLQRYRLLLFDEIEIYRGGFSTMAGSGAIGGLVNLSTGFRPPGIVIGYEQRSYDQDLLSASLSAGRKNSRHNLRFGAEQGPNHYRFKLGDATGERENSDYAYKNAAYLGEYVFSSSQKIDFRYYYGRYDNGSPRGLTRVDGFQGNARISEENWIMHFGWHQDWSRDLQLRSQVYLRRNWFDYRDPDISVSSHHYNQDAGGMIKFTGRLAEDIWLYTGVDLHLNRLSSSEAGAHVRRRFAVYGLGNWNIWQTQRISVVANVALREELCSDFGVIFLPRAGIDFYLADWQIFASIGRNFRAPAMNELYWQPGGNPDLQPESSDGFEAGIRYAFHFNGDWDISAGYYDIRVNRMIKWHPGDDGIWRAQNIEKVRSNGIEISAAVKALFGVISVSAHYKYGLAIKTGSDIPADPTVGNRLPYIPGTEFSGIASLEYGPFTGGVEVHYTGFRYNTIANDAAYYLPDFMVTDLAAGFRFPVWEWECTLYGKLSNITDTAYQLIGGYPLPLRTWTLGITFGLDANIFE